MANKFWSSLLTPTRCSRSIETLFFTLWVTKSVFSYQEFMMGRKNLTSLLYWPMFSSWALQIRLIKDRSVREGHGLLLYISQFSSVQSLSRVQLFVTPWTAARQASLSITYSRSSPKLMSIKSVMLSSHLILCRPLLLLPPIPPSIRVFSKESTLRMRWPKYWSFSFSIIPSKNTQDWSPLEWTGWISLQSKGLSRVFFNTTVQKHPFLSTQLSLQSNSHIHTWLLEKP